MNEPADDKMLEDYLHRKSALSMGYRRVYVEDAPPPELDRTIAARARRALRWLVPGVLAVTIAVGLGVAVEIGVTKYVNALVGAEKNLKRLDQEQKEKEERERLNAPVSVIIDPSSLSQQSVSQPTREEWLAKIDALNRAGKKAEAEEEQKKFKVVYPKE